MENLKNKTNRIKHDLSESYLQSLTEEQRDREMSEWNDHEVQQYLCPNGTITLEEFKNELFKIIDRVCPK